MRIAIVHDHLMQFGGAERVVEAMNGAFPDATIFTAVYDPKGTFASFQKMDIRTSFLQKFARSQKVFRMAFPLFPIAFEHFDLTDYDVVISSSAGFAHGIITAPGTRHICYCHTPGRYFWRYHEYVEQGKIGRNMRRVLPFLMHRLRMWDYIAAQRVTEYVANSSNVAKRIRHYYNRDSSVLYPPVDLSRLRIVANPTTDYFLVVSRLIGYKRVDLAVEAATRLGVKLKVVGAGPEEERLRSLAGPTVEFLGRLPDKEITDLLANCRALLFPGEEDFGITPLEAMASGRPVIAYGAGGALETVVEGRTGEFFPEQTVDALADAIARFRDEDYDSEMLRLHAGKFDIATFQNRLRDLVHAPSTEKKADSANVWTTVVNTKDQELDTLPIAAEV